MKTIIAILLLVACANGAYAQEPDYNLDFEEWNAASMQDDAGIFANFPAMHHPANVYKGFLATGWVSQFKVWRTTDAWSGQYAVVLNRWYNGARIWCLLGNCPQHGLQDSCLQPCAGRLSQISGHYKYINDTTSTARAVMYVNTYRTDESTGSNVILTADSFVFAPVATYTGFALPIQYTDTTVAPDSFSLRINISGSFSTNPYADFLYLDALHISTRPLAATALYHAGNWRVYPNPARTILYIDHGTGNTTATATVHMQLTAPSGKRVADINWPHTRQFDIAHLPAGIYLLHIGNSMVKRVVIEH